MKHTRSLCLGSSALLALGCLFVPQAAQAGKEMQPAMVETVFEPLRGEVTLGIGGTEDRLYGSSDLTVPLYKSPDQNSMLFLNGHWLGNSGHDEAYSAGLGFRHRLTSYDVILGINAFWDHGIYNGQSFDQFGTGIEVLTHWIDFRANGYFPNNADVGYNPSQKTSRSTSVSSSVSQNSTTQSVNLGQGVLTRTTTNTTTTTTTTKRSKTRYYQNQETAMLGFDTELGFLIPGLEKFMETRIFGGYTWFQDGYNGDISAATARLECRALPALIFDVEYKGDNRLLDYRNNWYYGMRAEIPFDLGNLIEGKSPFAGITQAFTPKWMTASAGGYAGPTGYSKDKNPVPQEVLRNRMNENIVRAWEPQMDYAHHVPHGSKSSKKTTVAEDTVTTESQSLRLRAQLDVR